MHLRCDDMTGGFFLNPSFLNKIELQFITKINTPSNQGNYSIFMQTKPVAIISFVAVQ
jgi:hypothetical protein